MSATFDPTLPTHKDHIRLLLGDIHNSGTAGVVENALREDEVIEALLTQCSFSETVARLADSLVAEFGQRPDSYSESGGLSIKWSERVQTWKELAQKARAGLIQAPGKKRRPGGLTAAGATTLQATTDQYHRPD